MNNFYNQPLHRYAVFTASCTFFLLIAGALVTSNDAGLSIPDWLLAYGSLTPPMVDGILTVRRSKEVWQFPCPSDYW